MSNMEIKKEIEYLREEIINHDLAYDRQMPTITDTEYDVLFYRLVDLERKYPEFNSPDSPTQKIITTEVEGLVKVKHNVIVGSQDKIHTKEELMDFLNLLPEGTRIIVQDKLDGLTVVLRYENGILKQGITRGGGVYGEDVTHVIKAVNNVPKHIDYDGYLEIRAEGLIPTDVMIKLWDNGELANARNIASGAIRTLSPTTAIEKRLECITFDTIEIEGEEFTSDLERIEFLKSLGFEFVNSKVFYNTKEDIPKLIDYVLTYNKLVRPTLNYKIDGLIIKVDDLSLRESLGMGKKNPNWSKAFKFEAEEYVSRVLGVDWAIGKTGMLSMTAIIEPVVIDNTTVSRASLANMDDIARRDIRINDYVFAVKANEIIPKILRPIKERRTGVEEVIKAPEVCPFCSAPIVKQGAYLYCTNHDCSGRIQSKIKHFVCKTGLDIDGLGDKAVELFIDNDIINKTEDVLFLADKEEAILALPKFGKKKFDKILLSLEKSKEAPLSKVLSALSIKNIAEDKSAKVAVAFKSMKNLLEASSNSNFREQLISIKDLGDICADSIVTFFNKEENINLINTMLNLGYSMEEEVIEKQSSLIENKTFVITGTLSKSRGDFKKYLENLGAKVTGTVTKKTDYLLLGEGEEGSTKHKKAIELGTKIINEYELNKLIKGE